MIILVLLLLLTADASSSESADLRCLDPPASVSEHLPEGGCKEGLVGYSWNTDLDDCVTEVNAGCAKTRNKFLSKDRCLETCQQKIINSTRCYSLPVVFSSKNSAGGECNEGFCPRPCPDTELRSIGLFYYDWNARICHRSFLGICPGDEEQLFSDKINAFPNLVDCLNECAPRDFKCRQPFAVTSSYRANVAFHVMYSFHADRGQCEPFIHIGPQKALKEQQRWENVFESLEECQDLCGESDSASEVALDPSMPNPSAPKPWQCTDVPALSHLPRNRSCLAYDNSNGYTFSQGECIPSDYNGCIDTYNKFKDMEMCTQTCLSSSRPRPNACDEPVAGDVAIATSSTTPCESWKRLARPIPAFTFDASRQKCVELEFDGCTSANNVFLDLGACLQACQSPE